MQYDLNQIGDPTQFQRLVNGILTARFGEDARLTPLHGTDGGSDGETASRNPNMEFSCTASPPSSNDPLVAPPRPGRYLFQAKYHRTGEHRLSDLRALVVREFAEELKNAVLHRRDRHDVNYFFVVTNVLASKDAIEKVDDVRKRLLPGRNQLHADIWWGERITAFLDWSPDLWLAYPELFPGGVPPFLAQTLNHSPKGLPRTFKLAIRQQHDRDETVKFRQIELEQKLLDLFVDLDVEFRPEAGYTFGSSTSGLVPHLVHRHAIPAGLFGTMRAPRFSNTALELLIDDELGIRKILLEGGPGQGKSTITQMAAQIYRQRLLRNATHTSRDLAWRQLSKTRLPIRLELRGLAEWLSSVTDGTLEQYIARVISRDSGGASVAVQDIHSFVERSSVILLLDGLDEIGSDSLRDRVLDTVIATIKRFEEDLGVDLRVVLTTRPPALTGRRDKLDGFARVVLAPMNPERIDDYLQRWLTAQINTPDERNRIKESFEGRRYDPHVDALARNPMQLSVLLQFIYLKGEAFPDRRAELYRDYFQIVIDRDVEKSPELRKNRDLVEGLHSFLGFHFHGATEIGQRRRIWNRTKIVSLAGRWLQEEGHPDSVADRFFALGEERFGLIVAVSGEGDETTYGFEVQPIQEYFAASYISNRLADGKAHEIFELLIHRNYWREVALFLAGLRRPNEKADLVARAKAADQDASRGWEQNGRSIVLQLLREGVLHQPRHVLTEAMDFVVELLDMKKLRVQRTPEGLIETICQLGELYPTDALRNRIVHLAEGYCRSDDEHALAVIHRVAARLLPSEQYTRLVWGYRGTAARNQSLVRMTCPYESPATLEELAASQDYWADVSVPIWARRFWRAALRHAAVIDVKYPVGLHASLVVEFATDYPVAHDSGAVVEIRAARPPAIWKLQQNVQAMRYERSVGTDAATAGRAGSMASRTVVGPGFSSGDVSYQFLPAETATCLRDLIETSNGVLSSLIRGDEPLVGKEIDGYLRAIKKHLNDPGISAWVACRCAIEILQRQSYLGQVSQKQELVDGVLESLSEFCGGEPVSLPYRSLFQRLPFGMPFGVRFRRGAPPVPLHRIVVDLLGGRLGRVEQKAFPWIADIPFPGAVIKSLVEACRSDLPQLLRFVGERRVVRFPHQPRLRVQDTQRILKICRRTDDQEILRGAATILLNTAFARIAEPGLVVKLLAAAPASQLVARIFSTTREYLEDGDRNGREKEWTLSRTVAELVLGEAERYPFRIVSRAAAFAAETEKSRSEPLFDERPDLVDPAHEAS